MTVHIWWERGGRIKWNLSLFVGHQITEIFTLYFSMSWTVDRNTLANRQEKEWGSSSVQKSICHEECLRIFKAETVRSSLLDVMNGIEGWNGKTHISVIDATQRPAEGWLLVANTVQAPIPAWPGLTGWWWVKALEKRGHPCPSDWQVVAHPVAVTTAETPVALAPTSLHCKKKTQSTSFKIPIQRRADSSHCMMEDTKGHSMLESMIWIHVWFIPIVCLCISAKETPWISAIVGRMLNEKNRLKHGHKESPTRKKTHSLTWKGTDFLLAMVVCFHLATLHLMDLFTLFSFIHSY